MIATSLLFLLFTRFGPEAASSPTPQLSPGKIAESSVGDGFQKHSSSVEVKLIRAFGTTETGSVRSHNMWLTEIQGGLMLTDVVAGDHWWGGNVEGLAQFMIGGQDHPEGAYFTGLNGGLSYHVRTGTPVDPFVSGSIGIAATDVGPPDLSGTFQFNEQIGAGARYLLSKRHAITIAYAYWHVSNGGIREPNDGINAHLLSIGFAWLF
jgi:hypothetical protein